MSSIISYVPPFNFFRSKVNRYLSAAGSGSLLLPQKRQVYDKIGASFLFTTKIITP